MSGSDHRDCNEKKVRLIDADALKRDIMSYKTMPEIRKAICKIIDNAPTIKPSLNLDNLTEDDIEKFKTIWQRATSKGVILETEKPHGEWLHPYAIDIACECSNCHMQMPITDYFNFCPNCGADMRGGNNETN